MPANSFYLVVATAALAVVAATTPNASKDSTQAFKLAMFLGEKVSPTQEPKLRQAAANNNTEDQDETLRNAAARSLAPVKNVVTAGRLASSGMIEAAIEGVITAGRMAALGKTSQQNSKSASDQVVTSVETEQEAEKEGEEEEEKEEEEDEQEERSEDQGGLGVSHAQGVISAREKTATAKSSIGEDSETPAEDDAVSEEETSEDEKTVTRQQHRFAHQTSSPVAASTNHTKKQFDAVGHSPEHSNSSDVVTLANRERDPSAYQKKELSDHVGHAPADSNSAHVMTSASMESAITDLMLGKTAFGATPMGVSVKQIRNLIVNSMLPKVTAAHKDDQHTLRRLVLDMKECGRKRNSMESAVRAKFATYIRNSRLHKLCRAEEAAKFTSSGDCRQDQKNLWRIKRLKCKHFASVSREYSDSNRNKAVVTKAGSESVESYIRRIDSTVCSKGPRGCGMLCRYLKAKADCLGASRSWAKKSRECKRKRHNYLSTKSKCNQFQTLMDGASCKHAVLKKDACESYAECYHSKLKAYRMTQRKVRIEEKDRKAEWRGLQRMSCLIGAFADGKVKKKEVGVCKNQTHTTSQLNITYPKIPRLASCTISPLYPATGAYKRREFAPLPALAKGMASAVCSGIQVIATTPARGSPRTCKCRRVTLNGPYSAGALVKCTNCLDVRRSRDRNSCPQGTKIFSPASRADWQTFLRSAGPLRHPHWIIDVTRPQNGCGGCKNHVMNSRSMAQRSWTTSDGSPWWLRSTKYTEPNGDYSANCFLNLWKNPRNGNDVTFNDGRCSYHSRSYYCQPIDMRLKPNRGSPVSCKCTKVVLTGQYSAGALVQCEQCLTVSRSLQKNSCPAGTKIFSPRSRGDWKTFLQSAMPLRAPNWIVDVTRPQNGCGGCTRAPMKSTSAQQATWRTSDRSPWWLRSSRYSEPNGDYTANCFLDLWRTPFHSEGDVKFNDWKCNYRSRSYYCQPALQQRVRPAYLHIL